MRYHLGIISSLAIFLVGLNGCQSMQRTNDSQLVDVAASPLFHDEVRSLNVSRGPLVQGVVGEEIDQLMDRGDRDNMLVAIILQPMNQTSTWTNSRRHIHYQVTPTQTDWSPEGYYCRQYQVVVIMSGEVKRGQGRLCRVHKDNWLIMPATTSLSPLAGEGLG